MTQARLKGLSDSELLKHTKSLVAREHSATLDILLHLNEVERRGLHLKLGYSSLFDYCTKRLKYSESAAGRRVQVARCIRRHPGALNLLRSREANLSTVALIAPILNERNHSELLKSICNKSQREVEAIASGYRPPVTLRDRVKPVLVRVPEATHASRLSLTRAGTSSSAASSSFPDGSGAPASAASSSFPDGSGAPASAASSSSSNGYGAPSASNNRTSLSDYSRSGSAKTPNPKTKIERKLLIQFLASEAFMKKYEQARALLSNRLSGNSFEDVFGALVDEFIDRHSPESKSRRREKRRRKRLQNGKPTSGKPSAKGAPSNSPRDGSSGSRDGTRSSHERSRHIPEALRDKVHERDGGRCTYVGKDGKRCGSTHALQIDHRKPFARGGRSTLSNLRLLCANHNRIAAEEAYGAEFMKRFPKRE